MPCASAWPRASGSASLPSAHNSIHVWYLTTSPSKPYPVIDRHDAGLHNVDKRYGSVSKSGTVNGLGRVGTVKGQNRVPLLTDSHHSPVLLYGECLIVSR
jgi:hypothetical protein